MPFVLRWNVERDIGIGLDSSITQPRHLPTAQLATSANRTESPLHDYCVVLRAPLQLINTLPFAISYRVTDEHANPWREKTVYDRVATSYGAARCACSPG